MSTTVDGVEWTETAIEEYMTTEDNKNQDGKEDDKDNKFPQLSEDSICFDMPRFMINKNGSSRVGMELGHDTLGTRKLLEVKLRL